MFFGPSKTSCAVVHLTVAHGIESRIPYVTIQFSNHLVPAADIEKRAHIRP